MFVEMIRDGHFCIPLGNMEASYMAIRASSPNVLASPTVEDEGCSSMTVIVLVYVS